MYNILAIDDDEQFLQSLVGLLKYKNYNIKPVSNPAVVPEMMKNNEYDCILLDVKMPGIDGISLLEKIIHAHPHIPVIMISGQSTLSIAVESIKKGAFDFLEKGADLDRLLITLQNAIDRRNWTIEREHLLSELYEQYQMVGQSSAIRRIFNQIDTVAPTEAKVLISGETGTGKELVARAIHLRSNRSSKPYIKVNCAAIPETLIESTFFGHKKGSFTGAMQDQKGKFELADGGTIFLDEISELPLPAQAKLLRVLQDGEIEKIGEQTARKVDVRIIAATNQDLTAKTKEGKFREDLLHRLKVFEIRIPPLRKRLQDIPILADHFLQKYSEKYNKRLIDFKEQSLKILLQQSWPGNIRMLENVIEKTVIFARGPHIQPEEIIHALQTDFQADTSIPGNLSLKEFLEVQEKNYLLQILILNGGKILKAAKALGLDRATLWRKMKKYRIDKSFPK
ncbi:MAG TPA: sigma-54-dependent Fis family transcriptional regulator [Caldithrix abyssi]|uniref:Sigma-54-dependent Fis family transcriptional regulator n=1 Tax=Caldithrix abyssi TaxID=187145 RepID=A0A7V4U2Z0_CALAY|nr:sigma-54-dependent Fis family transcriptional regulator [Caldithrix abyssi]